MSDISASTSGLNNLSLMLKNAAADTRRTNMRAAIYTVVWRWLALVALVFLLDLLVGMPAPVRWVALVGQAVFLIWSVVGVSKLRSRGGTGDEWAARVLEEMHPEIDNALIHAVQFAQVRGEVSADKARLIDRELRRAATVATAIPAREVASSPGEKAALNRMAVLLCVWAVVGITFSSGFAAIMPRLFLPWLDAFTPPYSATHFDVRPQGTTVKYDDSLAVSVKVSGRIPEHIALMTQAGNGGWHRVALETEGSNTYSVKLDGLRSETNYYVQANTGRSALYRIVVTRPPTIVSTHVGYEYPEYVHRKPSSELLPAEGLHGLSGTKVTLSIAANRPLKSGAIKLTNSEGRVDYVPLKIDALIASKAVGTFTINRPGKFNVALTAEDDQSSPDASHGNIKLDHDQRPTIWFATPGQDLVVTEEMIVPIHMKATDDVAVQRLEFHHHLNDKADAVDQYNVAPPAAEAEHTTTIDVKQCGAHPGDTVTYFAAAFDNAPGTPNVGETEVYTLKVVTAAEFAEALKEQRQASDLSQESHSMSEALKNLAQSQKDVAKKIEDLKSQLAAKPGDAALKQKLVEAQRDQKDLQQKANDLADQMENYSKSPSATDLERALKKKIAEIASQLKSTASGSMSQAQSADPSASARAASKAAKQLETMTKQMESQIEKALDDVLELMPLFNDLERFKELLEQQRQLVQKAQSFQKAKQLSKGDEARLRLLADAQSSISRDLSQVQKDLLEHAGACEQRFPKAAASARGIAAEIGSREIVHLMDTARDTFRQSDGPSGFENANNALAQMEAMVQKCNGSQGEASMEAELDISLKECLGKSGLGSSLAQFSPSTSQGQSSGMGIGGHNGSAFRGGKAYVPSVASMSGTGGNKKMHHANHNVPMEAGLSGSEVEVVHSDVHVPAKAGATGGNSYPVEYRKLIHEYFKSVAEKQ